jgi:hypothetical protein
MDFGEVLTKSGRLIWKFKILWLFGLLASCASGSGNPTLNFSFNAGDFNFTNPSALPQPMMQFFQGLADTIRRTPGWFFAVAFTLICGLGIILWLIGIFGRAGLTRGAWLADSGAPALSFGELVRDSLNRFWRVVGMTLLVGLPGFAIALMVIAISIFGVVTTLSNRSPGVMIVLACIGIPLFCLLIPIFWFLGLWGEISTVAVVNEQRGIFDSLRRGWQMIRRDLGPVILMGILILIVQLGFGLLIALLIAPIGVGALLSGVIFNDGVTLSWGVLIPLILLALLISVTLGSILNTYIGTIWTLLFRRLAAKV